ncbi:MAG: hypothetical protein M5U19_04360 [Microthrixaceae bacterium]|nr:hypothetical protein [Microthrixaceae bacterium]
MDRFAAPRTTSGWVHPDGGLIVVALLGLIMTPIAATLISSINNSAETHERLLGEAALQRITEAWTKDTQSADPTPGVPGTTPPGVDDNPVQDQCVDPAASVPGAPQEIPRITFHYDLDAGAEPPKAVTWVIRDDGGSATLVRRFCADGILVSATDMGRDLGPFAAATVRGPDDGVPDDFCPPDANGVGRRCVLVVPKFDTEVTATRRVPDYSMSTLPGGVPAAPTIFASDERFEYLNVRFTPSPGAVTQYELVLRKGSPTAPVVATQLVTAGSPQPASYQVTFSSLEVQPVGGAAVNYYVTARAKNDAGWGPYSDPYGPLNPQPVGPDKPSTPTVAHEGNSCVRVTWTPNANTGGALAQPSGCGRTPLRQATSRSSRARPHSSRWFRSPRTFRATTPRCSRHRRTCSARVTCLTAVSIPQASSRSAGTGSWSPTRTGSTSASSPIPATRS